MSLKTVNTVFLMPLGKIKFLKSQKNNSLDSKFLSVSIGFIFLPFFFFLINSHLVLENRRDESL